MLELDELKKLHDAAYQRGFVNRQNMADDLVFARVTQWDDNILSETHLQYRGEFNILRKATRDILADLNANEIQIDFEPIDENRTDAAELLDGLYRTDDRKNSTIEAYDYAKQESVDVGFGCWEVFTKYKTSRAGDKSQVVDRRWIPEACNTVMWDPNGKALDKSDARYVSILTSYSEDGYLDLVEELTGERPAGVGANSFRSPEVSYTFPWYEGDKKIWVSTLYHVDTVKDVVYTVESPFGETMLLRKSDIEDQMDELIDSGFIIADEKEIERDEVTKYIASGSEILSSEPIAGPNIPVIPVYGERSVVEGEEVCEGVTRLAKDPQRLRNFVMSYLADIASRSPREKPIFGQEQVQGFEFMLEENGADNAYPYVLQNLVDANGQPLPLGPVGMMPAPNIPPALMMAIEQTRAAVEDVANPALPNNIADPDVSGKAIYAMQSMLDKQSAIYQTNYKHAKRRDAEVYAGMAAEIYDAPRKVTVTSPDGKREQVEVMQYVIDEDTGEAVALNDLTNTEFEVYATVGRSYTSNKQQQMERLETMLQAFDPMDPMRKMITLTLTNMMDGPELEPMRDFARKQLVLGGFIEPADEEETAMMQQAQESQAPDANMVLAQAEQLKGQAAMMREQTKAAEAQAGMQNDNANTEINAFKAQTDRMTAQVKAQEVGANIDYKRADTMGKRLDNITKTGDSFRASLG